MRMDYYSDQIAKAIPAATADVTGDGSKFEAVVVSDSFSNLSTLKRHKLVYAVLDEHIKTGAIHALSIKAYTDAEWSEKNKENRRLSENE